jgi:hypothetical protein
MCVCVDILLYMGLSKLGIVLGNELQCVYVCVCVCVCVY